MKTTNPIVPLTVPLSESGHKSPSEKIEGFRQAMHKAGLRPQSDIVTDGKFHRFSSNGESNDKAGWYVFYQSPIFAGSFGCWRKGIQEKWSSVNKKDMTPQQEIELKNIFDDAKKQRELEEERNKAVARSRAEEIWDQSTEATVDHPYLHSKEVQHHAWVLALGYGAVLDLLAFSSFWFPP